MLTGEIKQVFHQYGQIKDASFIMLYSIKTQERNVDWHNAPMISVVHN